MPTSPPPYPDERHLTRHVPLSRRRVVGGLLLAPAALLVGCGDDETGSSEAPTTTGAVTATDSTGSTTPVATDASGSRSATGWASGGTELITVDYPDTAIFATANSCSVSLTEGTTEGPCYFHDDTTDDIADGKTGLPMQLCAQLVDESCTPLEGHTFEVWSCDSRGIYSGDTSGSDDADRFAGSFCTADDAEASSSTYLRGQATTDADGRANFATIFPGWYRGRTIHIHFAVTDPAGTTRVISQWCVDDAFAEEICTTHDQYADRGVQDTPLSSGTDSVFPAEGYEDYMLSLDQNPDGTLLAYGVVQVAG